MPVFAFEANRDSGIRWVLGTLGIEIMRMLLLTACMSAAPDWIARGAEPYRIEKHEGPVIAIAFSRNDQSLASADKTIRIRDLESQKYVCEIDLRTQAFQLVFSQDNKTLFSNSPLDYAICGWTKLGGPLEHVLIGQHSRGVQDIAASPDGKTVALAGGKELQAVGLWTTEYPVRKVASLNAFQDAASNVIFFPDSIRLAAIGGGGLADKCDYLVTWELKSRQIRNKLRLPRAYWNGLSFSNNDKAILASRLSDSGYSFTVHTIDAMELTARTELTFRGHLQKVGAVAFSADRKQIVSGDRSGTVIEWERFSARKLREWQLADCVRSVAISDNGNLIAAGLANGDVWILPK